MDQKKKIIENSLEMFFQKGCKVVTMDDVARDNGISKRTLYELFTDKNQLLEECLRLLYNRMTEHVSNYKGKFDNVIDTMFRMHNEQSENLLDLKKTFFEELRRYYYVVYKKSIQYFLDFHMTMNYDFLERGQAEGVFRNDLNKELVTKILIEVSNVMENAEFFSLKEYSRKELFREVMLSYVRGLCTDRGIAMIDNNLDKINK
jgi:AcrR family transcriptional regulator